LRPAWIPTIAQLEEAMKKLPSVYHVSEARLGRFRVAVHHRTFDLRYGVSPAEAVMDAQIIDFEIETARDPNGFEWRRWVYRGPVAV
jgi:hypothetical protein